MTESVPRIYQDVVGNWHGVTTDERDILFPSEQWARSWLERSNSAEDRALAEELSTALLYGNRDVSPVPGTFLCLGCNKRFPLSQLSRRYPEDGMCQTCCDELEDIWEDILRRYGDPYS